MSGELFFMAAYLDCLTTVVPGVGWFSEQID
jgi:hypothetical protein